MPLSCDGRLVALIGLRVVRAPAVERPAEQGHRREHVRGASDVVRVVVAGDVILDPTDTPSLEIAQGFAALIQDAVVDQHELTARADEQRGITLADIQEVQLELAIGCTGQGSHRRRVREHRGGKQKGCDEANVHVAPD